MNKKILVSLSVIGAVAAIAIGGTIAYFSDTETSTGNTFTAGTLDLIVKANGQDINGGAIFNPSDVKPGDSGTKGITLKSDNNDACGYAVVTLNSDIDNTCVEPEVGVDADGCTTVCTTPGCATTDGELNDYMNFTIFDDVNGNGVQDAGEADIITDNFTSGGTWSIGQLNGNQEYKYGIKWNLPTTVGNDAQSDLFSGTFTINITQKRNQFDQGCPEIGAAWPIQ
jgi:spore coat-associated protein N